jgi:DNA (cytosine-5)-methyltransferase 1
MATHPKWAVCGMVDDDGIPSDALDFTQTFRGRMNELALFAGAGGGILGGKLLGWRTVCAVEWDAYAASVLVARQNDGCLPPFPIWDDVQTFDGRPWRGCVDVVSGGFPCQDISAAGKGAGIDGERSGMWGHMARIVGEVRPRFVFVENSPLLVGRGLARVLGDLAQMGYDARWGIVGTHHIAGHCAGERLWLVAATTEGGWGKMVCSEPKSSSKTSQGRSAVNADTRCRADRIRALEAVAGEPAILGGNDGMAARLDRLHCLGNGQHPQVAAIAWKTLTQNPTDSDA